MENVIDDGEDKKMIKRREDEARHAKNRNKGEKRNHKIESRRVFFTIIMIAHDNKEGEKKEEDFFFYYSRRMLLMIKLQIDSKKRYCEKVISSAKYLEGQRVLVPRHRWF